MPIPFKMTKSDTFDYDGVEFQFDKETGNNRFLAINLTTGAPLQVEDPETGALMLPTVAWFIDMVRQNRLSIRRALLMDGVRNAARQWELDADEIRKMDAKAELRLFVLRAYDEKPVPRGNKAIRHLLEDLFAAPEVRERFGSPPSPSTVRGWLSRGDIDNRLMRDMLSMTGRVKRASRLDPVVQEIIWRHAADYYTNPGRNIRLSYAALRMELKAVNEGVIPRGHEEIRHPRPNEPYPSPSYETFRRYVRAFECSDAYQAKFGKRAVQSRWRGGGHPLEATRILELAIQDDTPLPGLFCIDAEREVPVGQPTLTLIVDYFSRCILGWHLTYSAPSQWTAAQAILHANTVKEVPARFAARYPELATICGKPSEIAWDNTLFHMARGMEDSLADAGIGLRLVGVDEPTHKAVVERLFHTLKTLLLEHLPGATYEIARMREFGYDPEQHAVLTIKELEALVAEAIAIYHVTPSAGLMNRQPALVWAKGSANCIERIWDIDQFTRSIGAVEYDCTLSKSGVDRFKLRFSDALATPALLDDLASLEPRRRRTKNFTAKVKIKYDPSDIGRIHVYNRKTGKYVTLPCTQPAYAEGLPLWLHQRVLDFAAAEALEFNTVEERLEARAGLAAIIEDIAPSARQRERRLLARLLESKHLRSVGGGVLETKVVHASPSGLESSIPFDMATPRRVDGDIVPARSRRGHEADERDPRDAGKLRAQKKGQGRASRMRRSDHRSGSSPETPPKKTGTGFGWGDVYE